jgi:molybdopterin-guanine dinucleotide biosynthesis protein A
MGTDKALLRRSPDGVTQLERMLSIVATAAGGRVSIAGPAERYDGVGYPVVEDIFTGRGPLAGIHACLATGLAEWNLIVAVDLPNLTSAFLKGLLGTAMETTEKCVLAAGQPLCGVYHQSCQPVIEEALQKEELRVTVVTRDLLRARLVNPEDPQLIENMNTPSDWQYHLRNHE